MLSLSKHLSKDRLYRRLATGGLHHPLVGSRQVFNSGRPGAPPADAIAFPGCISGALDDTV
jgi:hypothetical protein